MFFFRRKPLPPLSDFVEVLWLYEGYEVSHEKERLLPDGSVELVINLAEDRIRNYDAHNPEKFETIPGCVVSGPRSQFFVIDTSGQPAVAGVHFKPGGAFPFFRVPQAEMADQSIALEALWGSASSGWLRERVLAAASPEEKLNALERCLLEQLAKPLERHPAVDFALQRLSAAYPPGISWIVNQVGCSQRRFIQLFSDQVGLTPKLFSRISRFQKIIRTAHTLDEVNWVGMALDCGYYDQAHFVHDFQSFAGITPSEYLSRKTPHVNHVPMD